MCWRKLLATFWWLASEIASGYTSEAIQYHWIVARVLVMAWEIKSVPEVEVWGDWTTLRYYDSLLQKLTNPDLADRLVMATKTDSSAIKNGLHL